MRMPLHKLLGVTFLHASVGAWFLIFINLFLNSLLLKLNFNVLINNFFIKWEHHCTRGGVLYFYMRVSGHGF